MHVKLISSGLCSQTHVILIMTWIRTMHVKLISSGLCHQTRFILIMTWWAVTGAGLVPSGLGGDGEHVQPELRHLGQHGADRHRLRCVYLGIICMYIYNRLQGADIYAYR